MSKARRSKFRFLKWALVLVVILGLLTISVSPDTPPSNPPSASQILRIRTIVKQVRSDGEDAPPEGVSLRWDEVQGGAALAARTFGINRVKVVGDPSGAEIHASIPLKLGLWANVRGHIAPNPDGFPAITGRIGWLPVPDFSVRVGIFMARQWLNLHGADAPHQDGILHQITFDEEGAFAQVRLPRNKRLFRTLNNARSSPVDTDQVVLRYCRLASQQRKVPATDLVTHVQRAFADSNDAASNRAALVALAMLAVKPEVGTIAGDVRDRVASCRVDGQGIKLLGRQDLAKHWTLSAALTASMGAGVSEAMGTWKEVADSGSGGSGFSFVDLAADRSGVVIGQRAANPDEAEAVARMLSTITEGALLPVEALALSEGLTEAEFARQYVDIDSADYAKMVKRIDRTLEKTRSATSAGTSSPMR